MVNLDKVKVNLSYTLREVMQKIDENFLQIVLVVEPENNKLLGSITDGDIRRAILNGFGIEENIRCIPLKKPLSCNVNVDKEEILNFAIQKDIKQIPIVDSDDCLVGLEIFSHLLQADTKANKVILMVGGLGTRLRPLTDNTPKPMLKVGQKPILETIIKNFSRYGFTDIVLSVNYLSHIIEEYFGDGSKFGVKIEYVYEDKRMGTAGALSLIKEKITEPFFVMNGDLLTNVNFEHLLEYHVSSDSKATMCVREYDLQVPYGVVNVNENKIISIEEKPVQKFFVNAGIYLLDAQCLDVIPEDTFYDMPTLFETLIKEEENLVSFPIREYWLDIGRISDFEKANIEYMDIFGE